MKKYLYPFFVALVAISVFGLVSCSDDDDNPTTGGNGEYYCSLTVDGETFKGNHISGEIAPTANVDYLTVWVNTNYIDDTWFTFSFCADKSVGCILRNGLDICADEEWAIGYNGEPYVYGSINTENVDDLWFYSATDGSITILDYVESEYIELEFENCRLYDNNTRQSTVVNGRLKAPLKGVDATVNL